MGHPLLRVASDEKRAHRLMVKCLGRRQAGKELRAGRAVGNTDFPVPPPPPPRGTQRAFHRVEAAFRAIEAAFRAVAEVIKAHPPGPSVARDAALAALPVYRSRGKGKGVRHNNGGTRAAQRGALKARNVARNVARNRRAHRG